MAVVEVKELRTQRSAQSDAKHRSYTRIYQVLLDSPTNGEAVALTATDGVLTVPAQASVHSSDSFARVVSKSANARGDAGKIYDVTVQWDTDYKRSGFRLVGGGGQTDFDEPPTYVENPFARPPTITFRNDITAEEMVVDLNDKKVVNSAGRLFEKQPMRDVSRYTWIIGRNEGQLDVESLYAFNNTVNSSATVIGNKSHDAGTLKLTISTSGYEYDGVVGYWPITYEFQFEPLGWQPKPVNLGWLVYNNASEKKHINPIQYDQDGVLIDQPPSEPVLLALDGTQLAEGLVHTIAVPEGGGDYQGYATFDFGTLNFNSLFSSAIFL
jgi:hypothetical protein